MLSGFDAVAAVLLGGREVGRLTFRRGGCSFTYTDDLLDPEHRVLGQMFEEEPRADFREPVGLPVWFANLVPEQGSGLRRYYAAQFGERHVDDGRLLLSLGSDLVGAATVVPVDVPTEGVLVENVELAVDGGRVHLSALAGAQRKMSMQRDGDRLTVPARGATGLWIAKLPDRTWPDLVENEFLMMTWARRAGIDVPDVDLVPPSGVENIFGDRLPSNSLVYVVERFDRTTDGGRVHVEDLAQVTRRPPGPGFRDKDATYEGIGRLVRTLTGDDGFAEYLRRLVAMVVMGNNDAHLKNWSISYPDGRTPLLAPAYDLVCNTVYPDLPDRMTFPLAGVTRADRAGPDELTAVARYAGFDEDAAHGLIRETAARLRATWEDVRGTGYASDLVAHLDQRLARHPLTAA